MGPKRISTEKAGNSNKRNCKKNDDLNELPSNTNDKNITRPKRTYNKRQTKVPASSNEASNDNANIQTKKKRGPKKKTASSPPSQIINELLKDDNPKENENGPKDHEVPNEDLDDDFHHHPDEDLNDLNDDNYHPNEERHDNEDHYHPNEDGHDNEDGHYHPNEDSLEDKPNEPNYDDI